MVIRYNAKKLPFAYPKWDLRSRPFSSVSHAFVIGSWVKKSAKLSSVFSTIKQLKSFKLYLNNNIIITMIFIIKTCFIKNFDLYKTLNSKTNPGRASLTTHSSKCPYFSSTGVMGDRPLHCSIKNPILLTVEDQKNAFHSGCKVIDVTFPNVSSPEVNI